VVKFNKQPAKTQTSGTIWVFKQKGPIF